MGSTPRSVEKGKHWAEDETATGTLDDKRHHHVLQATDLRARPNAGQSDNKDGGQPSNNVARTSHEKIEKLTKLAAQSEGMEAVAINTMGEPHCMHVIADWPRTNTDFELLTKLDDEVASSDCFYDHADRISDVFDPDDWFVRPDLSDDDVPPGRRLRMNPGQFCLTPIESWTSIKGSTTVPVETTGKENND